MILKRYEVTGEYLSDEELAKRPPLEELRQRVFWFQQQYDSDPELKKLSDSIHHHRLMSGDACTSCIAIAFRRLYPDRAIPYRDMLGSEPPDPLKEIEPYDS